MTEENVTPEEDVGLKAKLKDLIKKAADDGATAAQLGELKAMYRQGVNRHPTKKRPNKATRIQKRKVAKQARKHNRNLFKGVKVTKGIFYTKQ